MRRLRELKNKLKDILRRDIDKLTKRSSLRALSGKPGWLIKEIDERAVKKTSKNKLK